MELNDEAAIGHRDTDVTSVATRPDVVEPTENRERVDDDKTTEIAAAIAAATIGDGNAAAFVEMAVTPAEVEWTRSSSERSVAEGEEDGDDDKTAETEAAAVVAVDEVATSFVFPFGEPVPNQSSSLMPPPGQRRTRPVITLCVNLHEMREIRSVYSEYADRTAAAAITGTTTTTTTATAPVAVSEGGSTLTTSVVSPTHQFRNSKPVTRYLFIVFTHPSLGAGFFQNVWTLAAPSPLPFSRLLTVKK